mgnify:CR=1 FL=1
MSTPHISAEKGDFAKTVLMPGDPLRAKFIADTFLQDVRQVTGVRGMLGFTGTYQGRPISVMGSGMGMPSIGIYSYELFKFYDVDNIIRIGSAGSYTEKAKLFDVVLSTGAVSESNYARVQSGFEGDITLPSQSLNDKLRASAAKQGIPLIEGNIHSSDVRGDGELCPVCQRTGAGQACGLPADHFRQLCGTGDHHGRAAPDELYQHDEGGSGRRVLRNPTEDPARSACKKAGRAVFAPKRRNIL